MAISTDDRLILDPLVESVRAAIEVMSSGSVHASRLHGFDDPMVEKRTYPLRAVSVKMESPLSDHLVLVGCFREDVLRELSELVLETLLREMSCSGSAVGDISEYELENKESAVDMLDGLWDEATVSFGMPDGDLMLVFGSGFIAAATEIYILNGGFAGATAFANRKAAPAPAMSAPVPAPSVSAPAASAPDDMEAQLAAILGEGLDEPGAADSSVGAVPFTGFADLSGSAGGSADPLNVVPAGPISSAIESVEVVLSAELGNTRLSLGAIASLGSDAVLTLDQRIDEPVQVLVNGVPYATARLVVVSGEYGIEILEVDATYADIQLAA